MNVIYYLALFIFVPNGKSEVHELRFQDQAHCLQYAAYAQTQGAQTPILCVELKK